MNFLEQDLISLDLIAFLCSDGWEVELNEVRHGMSCLSKKPIKCVKSTAKINYLAFILSFLEVKKSGMDIAGCFYEGKKVTVIYFEDLL